MGTLPISPTVYQVKSGKEYNQLIATPLWSNPDAMAKGYTLFVSYIQGDTSYVIGFNMATKTADTYQLATDGALSKVTSQTLDGGYSSLTIASFNNQQYCMGYDPQTGNFDFYMLGSQSSLEKIYTFAGPKALTTTSLFTYRGALYFVGYDMTNGAVAYYQVMAAASGALTADQIWSDTWAQGWTRFTFFQMAMENFFFKTNVKYINCNIDHVMDDPSTGSHPVGTHLPLSQDLNVVQSFYFAGDAYFATYVAASGHMTLNRFLANGQGWVEGASFKTFTGGVAIAPIYTATTTYLLAY